MLVCPACGHQSAEGARFCSQCGTALTAGGVPNETTATMAIGGAPTEAEDQLQLSDADAAAVGALPSGSALLIVQRGPGAGSRYLLDKPLVTAGRHPESDIFLDDVTVSRQHVEFSREGDTWRVRDVGSLNGTYVNRDRQDDALLHNGDEVRIGKFRLVFIGSMGTGSE